MNASLSFPDEIVDAIGRRAAELVLDALADGVQAPSPWLNSDGAAEYLCCPRSRIEDLVSLGRLRVAKDGRRSLFRREWLDAVVEPGSDR